ncbi:phosphohistidine phosphatase SixA [Pseudomonas taiwanensis]|uniref:phosphohistidine phosphatase SixA n=1 Tax=Pseudomonas taiwanensis TaxID=470150 RepID=UPI0015B872C4|nr:phosphohistidine phosphatase SixA [Pseudomonas taiwanensis]NWL77856.1 phosphohistidine phosphatase SixA [Pseudomonas taiwanensis]
MRLWLLRHGEAEPRARTDAERELTRHGRKDVLHSAAQLAGRPLGAILASPYVRAQQTAELVRDALGFRGAVGTAPWSTPESDPREALNFLAERSEQDLLLVTHNPFVSDLAGLLIHGHRQEPLPMGTATLAELEGDLLIPGLMSLRSIHHVRRH